jgi:hypothetical protein
MLLRGTISVGGCSPERTPGPAFAVSCPFVNARHEFASDPRTTRPLDHSGPSYAPTGSYVRNASDGRRREAAKLSPIVHQLPPPREQIAALISRLDFVAKRMRESGLGDIR